MLTALVVFAEAILYGIVSMANSASDIGFGVGVFLGMVFMTLAPMASLLFARLHFPQHQGQN